MKPTILYIDDEEANLRTFRSAFRRDFEILTALSGKEGLVILESENPDVLITDQSMPEMTGVELLKIVFETMPESTVSRIMLSGFAEDKEVAEAHQKYKLLKFISKPWNRKELKETIDSVISL